MRSHDQLELQKTSSNLRTCMISYITQVQYNALKRIHTCGRGCSGCRGCGMRTILAGHGASKGGYMWCKGTLWVGWATA